MELTLEELPVELVECTEPLLIGVRHHSAAMSRLIPGILDDGMCWRSVKHGHHHRPE